MTRHTFQCIDAHTCGNPVRVVVDGAPDLVGADMMARRRDFVENHDWVRTALMFEPRGHDAMSGSILYPPTRQDCDLAILFIEVSGCLPMCGHGTIGTVTVAIERGLVTPRRDGELRLETPAGVVVANYQLDDGMVDRVRLTNVPSFVHSTDLSIDVPGLGNLKVDVAYGGNFYAIIEPQPNYKDLETLDADAIRRFSPIVRDLVNDLGPFIHPLEPAISGVSHVMWTGAPMGNADGRNAVFYGERGIDRSPCGTGTSARMAQRVARGDMAIGDTFVHESIIGTVFTGRVEESVEIGDRAGIIPSIEGWARIHGDNKIHVDSSDPLAHGFLLS